MAVRTHSVERSIGVITPTTFASRKDKVSFLAQPTIPSSSPIPFNDRLLWRVWWWLLLLSNGRPAAREQEMRAAAGGIDMVVDDRLAAIRRKKASNGEECVCSSNSEFGTECVNVLKGRVSRPKLLPLSRESSLLPLPLRPSSCSLALYALKSTREPVRWRSKERRVRS